MKTSTKSYIILGAVAVIVLWWLAAGYNTLVDYRENVRQATADLDAAYQRRTDLLPNLVEVVKGYAAHEKDTFTEVARLRSESDVAKKSGDIAGSIRAQDAAYNQIKVVVEKYPQLKADKNFRMLQVQLEGTENRINQERIKVNEKVAIFNKKIRNLRYSMYSGLGDFKQLAPFQADAGAQHAPKIDMSTKK